MNSFSPHPDCPDLARRGPNLVEATLRAEAERVQEDLKTSKDGWRKGFTRRRVLGVAGTATVAALGTQYVETKVSYGKTKNDITLIDVFLRGGLDGLGALAPASAQLGAEELRRARGGAALSDQELLPLVGGWGLNRVMQPLMPFWESKQLAFVPAAGRPNGSRSHFDEQDFFEAGGPPAEVRTGLYNRMVGGLGLGSGFRALSRDSTISRSLVGPAPAMSLGNIGDFRFPGDKEVSAASRVAIEQLFRGVDSSLTAQVTSTMKQLAFAENLNRTEYVPANGVRYDGNFENGLRDFARLIKGGAQVEIGTLDFGGWDTHANQDGTLTRQLADVATGLAKFMTDLGPTLQKKVTVIVRSEFGRRVQFNGDGTDHGHGGVMMLLGAGINGGAVHGKWAGLADNVLDNGDVPSLNHQFDVIGEVAQKVLGLPSVATMFPGHAYKPIGVARLTP